MPRDVSTLTPNEQAMATTFQRRRLQTHFTNTSIPSGNTVTNTSSETDFESQITLPPNIITEGQAFHLRAYGVLSTSFFATLTLRFYVGSNALVVMGPISFSAAPANAPWKAECDISCASEGVTGSWLASGVFSLNDSGSFWSLGDRIYDPYVNTSAVTVDTFAENTLKLSAQWSFAAASETVTMRQIIAR